MFVTQQTEEEKLTRILAVWAGASVVVGSGLCVLGNSPWVSPLALGLDDRRAPHYQGRRHHPHLRWVGHPAQQELDRHC